MSDPTEFDPEAFLAEPDAPAEFDPEAFLAEPDAPAPEAGPASVSNVELAQRTRGPTVLLGNGQSMLRSAITTDVAPGGAGFTSSGAKVLGSAFTVTQGNVDPSVEDETAVRNAKLTRAFEMAKSKDGPKLGKAVEISRAFNVPVRQVLPNLPEFERAAEQAKFDPAEFYEKNKLLADVMMDSPETMAAVVVDPNVGPLVQAFRKIQDLGIPEAVAAASDYAMMPMQAPAMLAEKAKRLWDMAHGVDVAAADAQAQADDAAATEKRRNAKQTKFDSPEAKAIRESNAVERTALTLQRRYREARAASDMAAAGSDLAMAEAREELGMGDAQATAEAGRRVQDARAGSRLLLLGEGDALGFVGDNLQALVSTFDTLLGSAKGLAGGAALGAVAGAVAGAAATKSPAGAVAGAKEGAKLGAEKGRMVGGVLYAFQAEFGGKYLDLRDAVTDEGAKLSKLEALGGAAAYGLVAAYLENLGTEAQFAPGAEALKAQVRKLLTSDPLFRRRVGELGKAWVNGALTEGVTEGLQSTADQVVEYAAKSLKDERLQRGPAFNPEQALLEAQGGLFGGGVITGATSLSTMALESVTADRAAVTSPSQVAIIASLAEQAPVKGAAAEFAEVVRRATAETGAPVREFWVEAGELARLNQESGKTDEQLALELGEAAGPEAVQAYKAAVAEGGRFPVAVEKVLSTWATSPLGQALLDHTATSETAPTGAQLKASDTAQLQAIQQHALEMAQKAMEQQADEEGFDDALQQMQRDIVDAGRSGKEARDAVRVIRAFYETAKADNPSLTWKGVLEAAGHLQFAEGDNGDSRVRVKAMQPFDDLRSVIDFGGPSGDESLTVPQRAEMLYRDDVTGLRTTDGWELEGVPDGFMVAQVTTPDAKAINDNPEGSHDSTNELLLRMSAVVAKTDPKAARGGTNFWVRVKDQAALDALVAEVRAVMPEGMQAFGAMAATREAAGRALDKVVDDARTAGVSVPRGQTAFKGKPSGFAEGVAKTATSLEGVHEAQVDAEGPFDTREAFGNRAFLDRDVPGLLTRLGFLMSKPAKFVASLDLRGIRDTNIEMGKRAGDALLTFFGDRLVAMGGHAFAAAHMSGDEYAMKSDSKEALIEMLSDLRDELEGMPVSVEAEDVKATSKAGLEKLAGTMGLKTKGTLTIDDVAMPFEGRAAFEALIDQLTAGSVDAVVSLDAQSLTPARFRFGLGEGTYGKADRDLNTRKQLEARAQEDANGGGVPARRAEGDDLRERRSALEERRARAQYRGAPAANPFVDVAEGQADELAFDPGGESGAPGQAGRRVGPHTSVEDAVSRPAGEPLVDAEALTQFRADVGQMRAATKRRARLQAFLSYIEGTTPRPRDPADGSTVAGLTKADQKDVLEYGLDDPLGTFLSNRQLGLPNNPKRDPTKKRGDFASPHAKDETNLKLLRGEKLFYQQDVAPAVSPHKLSDGRSIIFDTSGEETTVATIDVTKATKAVDAALEAWNGTAADLERFGLAPDGAAGVQYVADARLFRESLTEAKSLIEQGQPESALDRVREAFRAARQQDITNPAINAAVDVLTEARSATITDAKNDALGMWLNPDDRQTLAVALDEFESQTGRLQQDESSMASTPRGYFVRPPPGAEGVARVLRVFLNKKADASTVMHESAHGFLEMLHNLASTEGAGLRTKQQWAEALKWLGVESYKEIKTEHHERFARAFEAYLREGKAPKRDLWAVFNRFKAWLTRIYRSATQLNVELDENVKRIFDRMLATDEEIARANGKRGASPWATAEEAGMTPEAFAEYQQADAEALAWATREAAARFTKQALDDAERDWKEQVDAARTDAVAEFEALPARKAQRFLEGKAQDLLDAGVSMAPVVLDREAVERAVGATGVKKFRTRKGGANPDETAGLVGYPTGADMLKAITQLPDMSKWVEQRAQALAEERDAAGAAELAQLRKDVEGGVQKYVEERIAREWAELGRRAEPGSDVSPLGRQVALETLKRAARLIVDRQRAGTLSTSRVLAKERAAAVKVRDAARTGNMDAARDWFREQSLQAYAHGATIEALRERERFEKMADSLTETAARARLGKASPALRDAVDYLLGAFGVGEPTDFTGETLQAAGAVLEESGGIPGDWFEALQMPELVRVGDWRNLSVANLRHLDAALRQLTAEARFRNEVQVGEKKAEREAVVEQLVTEAREVLPAKTPPGTRSSDTFVDTISSTASALDGFLLNPADLARDLTGDNIDSTWWKAIIEPIRRAKYAEAEFLQRAVEPVTKALEAMPDSVKAHMRDAVDGRRLFPSHIEALVPRQRHELLMMALNSGNEGNLQRLTDGRHITVEEVARALDTLTDEELRWVESVWDAVGALKEDAFSLEERETGLRPRGVEAVPFRLPSGRVLKGGYFPAVYDRRASVLGEKQAAEAVAGLLDPRYVRPGTSHGHLKQRVQRVEDAALSLDLSVIYRHLAQVAHDLAFREPVKSVGSLVLDKQVQEVMRERLGDSKTRTFLQWLKDVGGATGATVTEADGLVGTARGALSHVLLGWSTATAFGDFANLAASVASTPLKTKHLAAALKDFGKDMRGSRRKAMEASPWLRTMDNTVRKQFDEQMRTILDKQLPGPLQWYRDNAFALMEMVSFATATPVWLGAHRQAIAEGRTQEDAVAFADDVLSRVFPSHSPVDQSAILRDKGFWGKATLFYGYLSVAYRAQHRLVMPLFESEFLAAPLGQKAATVGTVAGRLLGFYVAYSVLGELLMGRGPEAGDDDEEEPGNQALRWRNWFVRKLVAGPLSTQPFLPASAAWEAMQTGKIAPSPRAAPASAIAEMLGRQLIDALNGDKPPTDRAIATAKLLLESRGLPVAPLDRQGRWLLNVALGNVEVTGPGDVLSGLVYGQRKDQPANIFRPTGTQ